VALGIIRSRRPSDLGNRYFEEEELALQLEKPEINEFEGLD
jgi:hypothetical protein